MRTSCSPCSFLTTSSKNLVQRACWHRGRGCVNVCKVDQDLKESLWMCVRGHLLTCKLVLVCVCWELWMHRAQRGPLSGPGTPVTFLQATVEAPWLPSPWCRPLVLPQRHREQRQRVHRHLPTEDKPPYLLVLFKLLFITSAQKGVNGLKPQRDEVAQKTFPCISVWWLMVLDIWIPIQPLCM